VLSGHEAMQEVIVLVFLSLICPIFLGILVYELHVSHQSKISIALVVRCTCI